ncbi:hypothetical protein K458DRAFT_383606 [Lentithecium fluviatile CBS 122367]|uniref:Uncharacterized protein n=1 Tax=Lentithecium fluviatile CBS 122367 TaxID=1168545 RepID=A0A6G1JIV3_9PLEO|nr:hypothetical protein K458DRAFT_383606 [Lentithecium fluviatile CBS 122367]
MPQPQNQMDAPQSGDQYPQGYCPLPAAQQPQTLMFASLNEARAHHQRVQRPAELRPEDDPTIAAVEADSHRWIMELVRAVRNLEGVGDRPDAKAVKYFTPDHSKEYPYADIEATCHVLFATVIDRCKNGFRGFDRDDNKAYGRQGAKTSEEILSFRSTFTDDRTGSCATRMQNVVKCLRVWKNSCQGIMHNDYNMFLLANHPLAFASTKHGNAKCNMQKRITAEEGKKARQLLAEAQEKPVEKPAKKRLRTGKQSNKLVQMTVAQPADDSQSERTEFSPEMPKVQNGPNPFKVSQPNGPHPDLSISYGHNTYDVAHRPICENQQNCGQGYGTVCHYNYPGMETLTNAFDPPQPTGQIGTTADANGGNVQGGNFDLLRLHQSVPVYIAPDAAMGAFPPQQHGFPFAYSGYSGGYNPQHVGTYGELTNEGWLPLDINKNSPSTNHQTFDAGGASSGASSVQDSMENLWIDPKGAYPPPGSAYIHAGSQPWANGQQSPKVCNGYALAQSDGGGIVKRKRSDDDDVVIEL